MQAQVAHRSAKREGGPHRLPTSYGWQANLEPFLISEGLLRKLPSANKDVYDTGTRGLVLRCRASGRHTYRLQVSRGRWLTIGRRRRLQHEASACRGRASSRRPRSPRASVIRGRRLSHTRSNASFDENLSSQSGRDGSARIAPRRQPMASVPRPALALIFAFASVAFARPHGRAGHVSFRRP